MEAVIFIGIPGSGKSSFYKERFFRTHVRISLDLLKTRNREQRFLELCLATSQRFVIDNTNPTREDRSRYIAAAKAVGYRPIGYYFQSVLQDCLRRNSGRMRRECVPETAVAATSRRLELPALAEGFDELFYVRLLDGRFVVEEWRNEV